MRIASELLFQFPWADFLAVVDDFGVGVLSFVVHFADRLPVFFLHVLTESPFPKHEFVLRFSKNCQNAHQHQYERKQSTYVAENWCLLSITSMTPPGPSSFRSSSRYRV